MKLEDREDVRELLAGKVEAALARCTPEQQDRFGKMYPGGVDKIRTVDLPHALGQCERTIEKNEISKALADKPQDPPVACYYLVAPAPEEK